MSSDEKKHEGSRESEKPVDAQRFTRDEIRKLAQSLKQEVGSLLTACKGMAADINGHLDNNDKKLAYLEKCVDALKESSAKKAAEMSGVSEKSP